MVDRESMHVKDLINSQMNIMCEGNPLGKQKSKEISHLIVPGYNGLQNGIVDQW
jgi:hypothetical protein